METFLKKEACRSMESRPFARFQHMDEVVCDVAREIFVYRPADWEDKNFPKVLTCTIRWSNFTKESGG